MKDKCCEFCPGCKRHCSACCPRCKYGKKYFSECSENKEKPKWARNVSEGSPAWQLLEVSHCAKKMLRKEKICEAQLFASFSGQEIQLFQELLAKIRQNLPDDQ